MAEENKTVFHMPKYQSHKIVSALKIKRVDAIQGSMNCVLVFEDTAYENMYPGTSYCAKHDPKAGGYYVVYDDGYESWSPAEAFEAGYKPVAEAKTETMQATSDARTVNNVVRHEYRKLFEGEKIQMQIIKDLGKEFYDACKAIGASRELSLAQTKIEEAVMWAVNHITK